MSHSGVKITPTIHSISSVEAEKVLATIPASYSALLVMDKFVLVLSRVDDAERQATIDMFFEWIAPEYENSIDIGRNRENVEVLVRLLGLDGPSTILDFGCGSGIASLGLALHGHDVIGVDSCPVMRRLAACRGLTVYPPHEVAVSGRVVDAVISSYVFHFRPSALTFMPSWSRVRAGGVLAANVHKGLCLDGVIQDLSRLGAQVSNLGMLVGAERHGHYVLAKKV